MEPTDMIHSSGDDRLETLLQQKLRAPPLADDGFSARVLAALPPRQNPWLIWGRIGVLTIAALAGVAVALWQSGDGIGLLAQMNRVIATVSDELADPEISLAFVITIAALALVLNFDDEAEMPSD